MNRLANTSGSITQIDVVTICRDYFSGFASVPVGFIGKATSTVNEDSVLLSIKVANGTMVSMS